MIKEFKEFILRGNVVSLAIAVIIGSAFSQIVGSLTTNIINPLLGLFIGKIDLSFLEFKVGSAVFKIGSFINSIINFLIIALVVFLIMKVINKFMESNKDEEQEERTISQEEEYLKDIRDILEKNNDVTTHKYKNEW